MENHEEHRSFRMDKVIIEANYACQDVPLSFFAIQPVNIREDVFRPVKQDIFQDITPPSRGNWRAVYEVLSAKPCPVPTLCFVFNFKFQTFAGRFGSSQPLASLVVPPAVTTRVGVHYVRTSFNAILEIFYKQKVALCAVMRKMSKGINQESQLNSLFEWPEGRDWSETTPFFIAQPTDVGETTPEGVTDEVTGPVTQLFVNSLDARLTEVSQRFGISLEEAPKDGRDMESFQNPNRWSSMTFVFRQPLQEYIGTLALTSIEVAFIRDRAAHIQPLRNLRQFLDQVLRPEAEIPGVRAQIFAKARAMLKMRDFRDRLVDLQEPGNSSVSPIWNPYQSKEHPESELDPLRDDLGGFDPRYPWVQRNIKALVLGVKRFLVPQSGHHFDMILARGAGVLSDARSI